MPTPGRTAGVDPNVIPLGSRIMVDGHVYVAEDTGSAVCRNVIDVYVEDCRNSFGRKYREVWILN